MAFTYDRSISSSQLRLLRPVGISHTQLRYDIVTVQRASAPLYTAVSYTWGTEDPTETIELNGREFSVRPNLWSCLHYIGKAAQPVSWNYIWVDAICIDQDNTKERNEQVKCMDQTYKNAAIVSVWLGLASLPDWVTIPESARKGPIKTLEISDFIWADHIDDLANRPYWSRFWVLQEFLLARNLRIHCSDTAMDWSDFKDIVVDKFGIYRNRLSSAPRPSAALPLVQGRDFDKHPESYQPFTTLLRAHHRSQCKDPRDRVFALLGLISPGDRALLVRVFPDYTLSEDVVRVIALGHVMDYDFPNSPGLEKLTTNSDDIFLGLGVRSMAQRRRLLRVAEMLDYVADVHPDRVVQLLEQDAWHSRSAEGSSGLDETEEIGIQYEPVDEFTALLRESALEGENQSRQCGGRWMLWIGVATCAVVGWYCWSKRS